MKAFDRGVLGTRLHRMAYLVKRPGARARLEKLRGALAQLLRIEPLYVVTERQGYVEASRRHAREILQPGEEEKRKHPAGTFHLQRLCLCCNDVMPMRADYLYARDEPDGSRTPNWRERLVCAGCGMNNRQRLIAKLAQQAASEFERPRVYLMEQVTPIVEWVRRLPGIELHTSEYLGHQYRGGQQVDGVRHEDVMNLSYADGSFDLIVSNDVLEHLPDPVRALHECFRVLKPGGTVLATFPFHSGSDTTKIRARLTGDAVEHLLPPEYHGNPVSSDGSLVFQDFGWDLIGTMRSAGFSTAQCEGYANDAFGHLGPGLLVFRMRKPAA